MHKDRLNGFCTLKDILLIMSLLVLFLSIFIAKAARAQGSAAYFEITTSSGKRYIYSSGYKGTVRIASGGYLYSITFSGKKARVSKATCPDRLCTSWGEISLPGERIICVPGRLVITAVGDTELDAINR